MGAKTGYLRWIFPVLMVVMPVFGLISATLILPCIKFHRVFVSQQPPCICVGVLLTGNRHTNVQLAGMNGNSLVLPC